MKYCSPVFSDFSNRLWTFCFLIFSAACLGQALGQEPAQAGQLEPDPISVGGANGEFVIGEDRMFVGSGVDGPDIMDVRNFRLIDYRRMFQTGRTPAAEEMQGRWRGVNKGVVNFAGYNQFIKEIGQTGDCFFGDNIQVHQVSGDMLRCFGWQPKFDDQGQVEREGKFMVQDSGVRTGAGGRAFRKGAVLSYRDGGNSRRDPARLLVDRVVMLDDDHMLGRATARFGPLQIPLAWFVLERVVE